MSVYLNTTSSYKDFKILLNDEFFVDKSGIIEQINKKINTKTDTYALQNPAALAKHLY